MEIQLNDAITVETDVPFLEIHTFTSDWKLNQHGIVMLSGLWNPDMPCQPEEFYDSIVKIKQGDKGTVVFCGCVTGIEVTVAGNVKQVTLEVTTGSCQLDRKKESQSFQDVESTYEDVIRALVEANEGRVICTAGNESVIEQPVIRYQETVWEFAKRLASYLGTYIVADVEVGKPNIWFGIPKAEAISQLSEEDYQVSIRRCGNDTDEKQMIYEVQSRTCYPLGATASFWGQSVMVIAVQAAYQQGELMFTYLLSEKKASRIIRQELFCGMELLGTVEEIREEQVKIALEIDDGISTGNYFYDWYPETGNGVYAMPEKGAEIFLTFCSADEREGFACHCLPMEIEPDLGYRNRYLKTPEENRVTLYEGQVSLSAKENHKFLLSNSSVNLQTSDNLRIKAADSITIDAGDIYVKTLDVIEIHQG